MSSEKSVLIEVVYGNTEQQYIETIKMPAGSTVQQVLDSLVTLPKKFPNMDIDPEQVGVFSKHVSMDRLVEDGERIEIYRPLKIDPKLARRLRSAKNEQ